MYAYRVSKKCHVQSAVFPAEYQPNISSAEYQPKKNSASRISAEKKCQPEFGYKKIRLRGLVSRFIYGALLGKCHKAP